MAMTATLFGRLEAENFTLKRRDPSNPPRDLMDFSHLTDQDRTALSEAISQADLNCPKVLNLTKEGENAHGTIVRISCSSEHGEHKWDIRMTGYPISVPTFAPW